MLIIDLHSHAELSNPRTVSLTLADYVAGAAGRGIAVAITEHNRVYDRGGPHDGVLVLPGMEVLNDFGDFLVFGAPADAVRRRDIFELIDCVHAAGGIVIVPHPYRGQGVCRAAPELAERIVAAADAVETLNGLGDAESWQQAAELAARLGKPMTGGSDAHRRGQELRTATFFSTAISSVADLVREVRAGRCEPVRVR